jgi:hypothetical protein
MQPVRLVSAVVAWACAAALLVACGGSPAPEPQPPKKPAGSAQPAQQVKAGELDRRQLDLALLEGPAWLLERVPITEVMDKGKFVGWRVEHLPEEWAGVDLRSGDVVTAVNGMPLETPDDLWAAWTTLSVASELKIAYSRDDEPRELSVPIHGQPDPQLAERLRGAGGTPGARQATASKTIGKGPSKKPSPDAAPGLPPKPRQGGPKRKPTIVIKSHEKPYNEGDTSW